MRTILFLALLCAPLTLAAPGPIPTPEKASTTLTALPGAADALLRPTCFDETPEQRIPCMGCERTGGTWDHRNNECSYD